MYIKHTNTKNKKLFFFCLDKGIATSIFLSDVEIKLNEHV